MRRLPQQVVKRLMVRKQLSGVYEISWYKRDDQTILLLSSANPTGKPCEETNDDLDSKSATSEQHLVSVISDWIVNQQCILCLPIDENNIINGHLTSSRYNNDGFSAFELALYEKYKKRKNVIFTDRRLDFIPSWELWQKMVKTNEKLDTFLEIMHIGFLQQWVSKTSVQSHFLKNLKETIFTYEDDAFLFNEMLDTWRDARVRAPLETLPENQQDIQNRLEELADELSDFCLIPKIFNNEQDDFVVVTNNYVFLDLFLTKAGYKQLMYRYSVDGTNCVNNEI